MNTSAFSVFQERLLAATFCLVPVAAMLAPRLTGPAPVLIAILALAAFFYSNRCLPEFSKGAFFWALGIPALMALSALWGIAPATSFARAYKTLPVTLSGALLWDLARTLDDDAALYFRRLFPRAVIFAGAICALELYNQGPLYHMTHTVISDSKDFNLSPINRSVVVFILSAFAAFFCLQKNDYPPRQKNILLAALAIVVVLVLLATKSQSAQLAFILGAVFYFGFLYRHKAAWIILGAVLSILLLLTPWLMQFLFHHIAAQTAKFSFLGRSYANQRLEIWDFISRRALERPLLGHGAEATRTIKNFDTAQLYWPGTEVLHPHNFAVQIWMEFGVLGAVIASVFFIYLLRRMQSYPVPEQRLMLSLFIASLSVATTGYGLWQGWWLGIFCLLFGFVAILARKPAKNNYGQ